MLVLCSLLGWGLTAGIADGGCYSVVSSGGVKQGEGLHAVIIRPAMSLIVLRRPPVGLPFAIGNKQITCIAPGMRFGRIQFDGARHCSNLPLWVRVVQLKCGLVVECTDWLLASVIDTPWTWMTLPGRE